MRLRVTGQVDRGLSLCLHPLNGLVLGMNRIEISVLKPQAALDTFAKTWRYMEAGKEAKPRLAFGSLRELFSTITEKRLELLRYVATHESLNVRQLAEG